MVKTFTKDHNGVNYFGVRDDVRLVTGSITKDGKKWILSGHPKINRTKGSYKFGDEIQITIWNSAGTTIEKPRVSYATNWDTIEIYFPPDLWKELVETYAKLEKPPVEPKQSPLPLD